MSQRLARLAAHVAGPPVAPATVVAASEKQNKKKVLLVGIMHPAGPDELLAARGDASRGLRARSHSALPSADSGGREDHWTAPAGRRRAPITIPHPHPSPPPARLGDVELVRIERGADGRALTPGHSAVPLGLQPAR